LSRPAGSVMTYRAEPLRAPAYDRAMAMSFPRMGRADFSDVARWWAMPHVQATEWGDHEPTLESVEAQYGQAVDGLDPTSMHLVVVDGVRIGYIQSYVIDDYPEWAADLGVIDVPNGSMGIDYLIGEPGHVGKGHGTGMIRGYLVELWRGHPTTPAVVVGVDADNLASWHALESAGFTRRWEGVLPSDVSSHRSSVTVVYQLDRPVEGTSL
jgi:aminoglycoside 6'-N-acetyltransferase